MWGPGRYRVVLVALAATAELACTGDSAGPTGPGGRVATVEAGGSAAPTRTAPTRDATSTLPGVVATTAATRVAPASTSGPDASTPNTGTLEAPVPAKNTVVDEKLELDPGPGQYDAPLTVSIGGAPEGATVLFTIDGWGKNVLNGSNITIRETAAITIGVIVGRPWVEQTVELDGLNRGFYSDQTWQIGDNASLRLVNTNVYGWEPNVFADNTLIIRNSDYSGSAVNSGDAHYIIENSVIGQLVAYERVRMTVTGSVITGDVIANDNTEIILIDSHVEGTDNGDDGLSGGNIIVRGNGRVILRNSTLAGTTIIQDAGEVVTE